jgi:hypothetical protein
MQHRNDPGILDYLMARFEYAYPLTGRGAGASTTYNRPLYTIKNDMVFMQPDGTCMCVLCEHDESVSPWIPSSYQQMHSLPPMTPEQTDNYLKTGVLYRGQWREMGAVTAKGAA